MAYIFAFIKTLTNCEFVNLSDNSLEGANLDTGMKMLLCLESIKCVDITYNPLASIRRKDFFDGLGVNELNNLIWVTKKWINSCGWRQVVTNKFLQKTVLNTHKVYYNA